MAFRLSLAFHGFLNLAYMVVSLLANFVERRFVWPGKQLLGFLLFIQATTEHGTQVVGQV